MNTTMIVLCCTTKCWPVTIFVAYVYVHTCNMLCVSCAISEALRGRTILRFIDYSDSH